MKKIDDATRKALVDKLLPFVREVTELEFPGSIRTDIWETEWTRSYERLGEIHRTMRKLVAEAFDIPVEEVFRLPWTLNDWYFCYTDERGRHIELIGVDYNGEITDSRSYA